MIFERVLTGTGTFESRTGARAELWWSDLATGTARPLAALNGKSGASSSYLPTNPATNHTDDTTLNYEPTIGTVASGGYAWVVFMSRRLYGNVATVDPYWSDPRYNDISQTPTTKKLWIAAIDLEPTSDDPSHPAFYLPAQELLAGNTRGFWVASPCRIDGEPCSGGDECCGGFCVEDAGSLVCGSSSTSCSKELDRCTESSDCCDAGLTCIDSTCMRQYACNSCSDCGGQACVAHSCGACVNDLDCCSPLVCIGGECVIY